MDRATRMRRMSKLTTTIAKRIEDERRVEAENRERELRAAREKHGTEPWWDHQIRVHMDWWVESAELATTKELVEWGKGSKQWYMENGK